MPLSSPTPTRAKRPSDTATAKPGVRHGLVLRTVLASLRPLVTLLVKSGVTYPALAQALKAEFVGAAQAEIDRQGMKRTDSAVTLLSGVHRKDVRALARPQEAAPLPSTSTSAHGLVGEVVAKWLHDRHYSNKGRARVLPRSLPATARSKTAPTFDALVTSISQDVRPKALLDEMLRLGLVTPTDKGIRLDQEGFAPRQGLDAMCEVMAMNLHDHAAAAVANVNQERNLLEQSIYVDDITAESAQALHAVAKQAWRTAFDTVVEAANLRVAHDQRHATPPQRRERARFGAYYYHGPDEDT
jgi:hypothetical protein